MHGTNVQTRTASIIGKARSWLTITIVCAGTRLRDVEREMEIRQGSALELLRTALDDLGEHYAQKTYRSVDDG